MAMLEQELKLWDHQKTNIIGGEIEADRNIISGNGGVFDGVFIRATGITLSSGSNNNRIGGNYIGSDANGEYAEEFTNSSHGILIFREYHWHR